RVLPAYCIRVVQASDKVDALHAKWNRALVFRNRECTIDSIINMRQMQLATVLEPRHLDTGLHATPQCARMTEHPLDGRRSSRSTTRVSIASSACISGASSLGRRRLMSDALLKPSTPWYGLPSC